VAAQEYSAAGIKVPPAVGAETVAAGRPSGGGRRLPVAWIGAVPFLAYVGIFLILPTVVVVVGAFAKHGGGATLSNIDLMRQDYIVQSFKNSVELSIVSAVVGAVVGAVLAYAIATGNPNGVLRRTMTSACGVLAQFGGVTLAFAFLATIGPAGLVTDFLRNRGIDIYSNGVWLYDIKGLILVYTYFQIPLMVLVFLPALDGIRPQWREATASLGGTTWHYWRHVAAPLLAPAFFGSLLLLFANSFSAYATAAALINQGGIIVPLQISNTLTSEVNLGQENFAKALALGMVVIVAVVMTLYVVLQRRTARWLR
jgi:putative spermidine/putrescine transport system permease protein